jgi:acetylornithine deacetylase/succinyl-diaminopimelate desuccinylase-like protein
MSNDQKLEQFFMSNSSRIRQELYDFLRIPSVSARSEHNRDTARAAEWLAGMMRLAGLETEIHATAGHPIVVGRYSGAGTSAPTFLIYGHYDVQPAEPLELWTSPPFEPTVRNGRIYARGSVDDKGQLFLHVKALEAHMKVRGGLPVNIILLAEGEEEVGSANLSPFVEKHAASLHCDGVAISDSSMFAPGQPSILSSLRGLAYFQIDVVGPASDLHSGIYGGAVMNPATALARIIASFHDADGRVTINGFYDSVRPWSDRERQAIRSLGFQDANFLHEVGAPELFGEKGYSTPERVWTRPTCEVNGLLSGYTGEGAKTVLPSKAMAKVSCRLVPDQTPEETGRLMRAHVAKHTPPGVRVEITQLHGGNPWKAELDGPLYDAARSALRRAFGKEPVMTGEGGSIPVVGDFTRVLGAPVLLMGFGLPGENAHAPDEWMSEENFEKGMRTAAYLWDEPALKSATRARRTG